MRPVPGVVSCYQYTSKYYEERSPSFVVFKSCELIRIHSKIDVHQGETLDSDLFYVSPDTRLVRI